MPCVSSLLTCSVLPQTKNEDESVVCLNQLVQAAIRSVPRPPQGENTTLVFQVIKPAQVSVAFARSCRKQQVHDYSHCGPNTQS